MYNEIIIQFIINALNDGWIVKKHRESYVFSKKHENKKETFSDNYLKTFIKENLNRQNL